MIIGLDSYRAANYSATHCFSFYYIKRKNLVCAKLDKQDFVLVGDREVTRFFCLVRP
jgi:hypothetical protein